MTRAKPTPVRAVLVDESSLHGHVADGLGAMEKAHAARIEPSVRTGFADSLDLDRALVAHHPVEHRWDYLLGHAPSGSVVGVELHSARDGEIQSVIHKRRAAQQQLRDHLRPGVTVARWLWVASGSVDFHPMGKARRRLDEAGIELVGRQVLAKHLPAGPPATAPSTPNRPVRGAGARRDGRMRHGRSAKRR